MKYEEALAAAKKQVEKQKKLHIEMGREEEDFFGQYRILEIGEDDYSYTITTGSLRGYREMSPEELQEELEQLWEELEDLTDEIEELEEDPSAAEELENLLDQKEDVELEISLVEQILDEKSR